MNYPKEILRKRLGEVSETLQDLVFSSEKTQKIQTIADRCGLNAEQRVKLEELINIILIRLEPVQKFRPLLVDEVGVAYDQAIKISLDINTEIFTPVMSELQGEWTPAPTETPTTPEGEGTIDPNEKLLPNHEQMEAMDGAHDHTPAQSSTTTPVPAPAPAREPSFPLPDTTARVYTTAQSTPVHKISSGLPDSLTRASSGAPATPTIPMMPAMPSFNATAMAAGQGAATRPTSIVDQKLRGLVRGEREETHIRDDIEQQRKAVYKENDPYREPIE